MRQMLQKSYGPNIKLGKRITLSGSLVYYRYIYLMMIPGIAAYFFFSYLPMYGMIIAFQNFSIIDGFRGSEWIGLKNFADFFGDSDFSMTLRSTLAIGILRIAFSFPAPIIFALMLNELKDGYFKKASQTISYLPHFISWATIGAIVLTFISVDMGPLNSLLIKAGLMDKPIHFIAVGKYFWPIVVSTDIWRELGWNTIFYIAVISTIDKQMYESAIVDGAGKWKQVLSITMPNLIPAIAIMLILNMGNIVNAQATDLFNQLLVLRNDVIREYSDVLDVYVYKQGLGDGMYSYAAAVGIFKGVVSLALVLGANKISKLITNKSIL